MAFTGNYMCTSFKKELLYGVHDFANAADTFYAALYDNNASFTAATTAYTATDEVSGTGYVAGGQALTNVDPSTSGTTASTTVLSSFIENRNCKLDITCWTYLINTGSFVPRPHAFLESSS